MIKDQPLLIDMVNMIVLQKGHNILDEHGPNPAIILLFKFEL